ncbi:MAG: hypothetical protein EXS31_09535 [Pedosphaera sp.]|nr:hypothetical protein [Pedosphaera sp.]
MWAHRGWKPLAIECKWSADQFSPEGVQAFVRAYPDAEIVVVAQDVDRAFRQRFGEPEITFLSLPLLIERIGE